MAKRKEQTPIDPDGVEEVDNEPQEGDEVIQPDAEQAAPPVTSSLVTLTRGREAITVDSSYRAHFEGQGWGKDNQNNA